MTTVPQSENALDAIYRTIDRARTSWRAVQVADGLVKVFLVVGGGLVAGLVADNLLHLPEPARLVCVIALAAALIAMLARFVVYPLARPVTDEMVAAHVERAFPELDNRLINAVLFSGEKFHHPLTRQIAASQIEDAAQDVGVRNLARPVDVADLRKWGLRALVLAAAAVLYGVLFTNYMGNALSRFLHPYTYIPPITNTLLSVRPGEATVLQGGELAVEARVGGVLPEKAWVYVETAGGDRTSDTMAFEGDAFTYKFANVQRDFTYRIKAGDATTPRYLVTVRNRPAVTGLDLTYAYPAYTGLPSKKEADAGGDIRALVGTRVRLEVRTGPARGRRPRRGDLSGHGRGEDGPDAAGRHGLRRAAGPARRADGEPQRTLRHRRDGRRRRAQPARGAARRGGAGRGADGVLRRPGPRRGRWPAGQGDRAGRGAGRLLAAGDAPVRPAPERGGVGEAAELARQAGRAGRPRGGRPRRGAPSA